MRQTGQLLGNGGEERKASALEAEGGAGVLGCRAGTRWSRGIARAR